MGLFRRRNETLNEKLMREAGLTSEPAAQPPEPAEPPQPLEPEPRYDGPPLVGGTRPLHDVGITGVARPRQWDVVTVAEAPEVQGKEVSFVTLPDGTVIVDDEQGDANLGPLADAVEEQLRPPYRARGVRQTEALWGLSASAIDVARFEAEGERIELAQTDEGKALTVDGRREFGSIPELEHLGEAVGERYAVEAERLDADLWEVRVHAL
jgi:hypothetical protein